MTRTLAELRAEKEAPASLPTRRVPICLDQKILADVQRLTAERTDLLVAAGSSASEDGEQQGPPKRVGQSKPQRLAEIDAELEPLYEQMRAAEGELLLRARPGGTWLRWKNGHPAIEKNEADERLTYGMCSAADLLDDLGKYVVAWNGDDFGPGEWDWFKDKVAPADLAALVTEVVSLHEQRVNAPKGPSNSSVTPPDEPDSPSPAA